MVLQQFEIVVSINNFNWMDRGWVFTKNTFSRDFFTNTVWSTCVNIQASSDDRDNVFGFNFLSNSNTFLPTETQNSQFSRTQPPQTLPHQSTTIPMKQLMFPKRPDPVSHMITTFVADWEQCSHHPPTSNTRYTKRVRFFVIHFKTLRRRYKLSNVIGVRQSKVGSVHNNQISFKFSFNNQISFPLC